MKFLDLRKCIFSYLYIIFGIISFVSSIAADIFLEPAPTIITHEPMPAMVRNSYFSTLFMVSAFFYLACLCALGIEILIRAIVEKKFPNLKPIFKINMPDKLNKILSIIFHILFIAVSLPILLTLNDIL